MNSTRPLLYRMSLRKPLTAALILAAMTSLLMAQEPLRVRRNIFGMHNLKDGGPAFDVGMEWTKHMAGPGFVFDWVTDINPWIEKAFQLGLIPCIRVQECNGGCTPNPGYAGNVAWAVLNYKIAHPEYAERIVYFQLWNEPSDPRDSVPPDVYANYLIAAHNAVHQAENDAAAAHPGLGLEGTLKTMTPGQNGPSWWTQAVTANPNCKLAFDVWGTHPYPEATPPHYNLHDGDIYIETSKSIDSYLMDLDVIASPHGNPPVSRRGFPVMITETAYGDHLGISYEGWPKTNRQMAADYNVDAFGERWYKWPEIIAAHPFILCNFSWEAFAFVQGGSGSVDSNGDGVDEPTAPYPQYTAVHDLRLSLEGAPPSGRSMAPARLTPFRGSVGTITGTITRADTSAVVPWATVFTDGYEFGHVSMYDGVYEVHDVPIGTYTLSCSKNGYATGSQQITVSANQTTTANFALTYIGKVSKGFYFVDTFNGDCGCSGCSLSATYLGQSFTTPSDVYFIKYAACKPNADNVTIRFSIRQGNDPNGPQIGPYMTATLEPGVGGNMIGGEWPDGQEPQVLPNTQYTLRIERTDGASQYCYASNCNPYSGGHAWVGGTAQTGWDFYSCMRGLTQQVAVVTGTIAGTVLDSSSNPISGATVSTSPGGYSATTNASGQYTISSVPVGTYSVTASKSGYTPQTVTGVVVQQNQTTTVNFSLPPGPTTGTIAGTVKDNSNNPLSGATVQTTSGGYSTTTAGDGTYTLANVAPATYTVQASKTGYLTQQQINVVVTAGQTTTVNFALSPEAPFGGIANGNMEGGSFNDPNADHKTANYWHQYTLSGFSKSNVTWLGSGAHSADYVQDFWEANWVSGIYQQVPNAQVSLDYQATVWVKGSSADVLFWVGIDPTGGTNASSANIIWSNPSAPGTTWTQISTQATASSSTITMFVAAQNPTAVNRNAYIDDASMVELGAPVSPTIALSPTTLSPSCSQGSNAASQTFTVQNTGGGMLSYTISDNVTWLACSPAGGTSTGEADTITVTYTTSSLSAGTYNGTITVSDPNATNNPQTIAVTLTVNASKLTAAEDFNAMPSWTSSFDASWGGSATWSIVSGGQAGNCLQATRSNTGSSAKVKVYDITAGQSYTVRIYMKCASSTSGYWRECAYKFGTYTAQDFDNNSGTWTMIQKFSNTGTNGNGNTWTQYTKTFSSGSNTKVSVGFKTGNSSGTSPTIYWDTLRIE